MSASAPPPAPAAQQPQGKGPLFWILALGLGCCGISALGLGALTLVGYMAAKKAMPIMQDGVAQVTMASLPQNQRHFRDADKDQNGKKDYAKSMKALVDAGAISLEIRDGTHFGYVYTIESADDDTFTATALAQEPAEGMRSYFVDQTGVVRARDARQGKATADDPKFDVDVKAPPHGPVERP